MKITKSISQKVLAANRTNARKSTGPRTGPGRARSSRNALKHGVFERELQLSAEDRPEFEDLRARVLRQLAPPTPLQEIAAEQVVACSWRCKRALRLESSVTASQNNSRKESEVHVAETGQSGRMERWYGSDYKSLGDGLRFLRSLRETVLDTGLLHIEKDGPLKEQLLKGFGPGFYDRLIVWKGLSVPEILAACHLAAMQENYDPQPSVHENPEIMSDPKLKWQMVAKLVEAEIEHLETILKTRKTDLRETPQTLAEFSPRYFADASRDLHRAVAWLLMLKERGL
jgi:hypothetical protein